jgi:hypothetical protein
MLISANIGRVSWEKPNSVYKPKRFLGVRPFGDYLLRGRGANIEITFHLVRNKLKSVKSTMVVVRSYS